MKLNYSKAIILSLIVTTPLFIWSQVKSPKEFYLQKAKENTLEQVKLDFSVPDIPAFKVLGKDPSNILKPSSAKDLALMVGNFRSSGSFIIPKNFALEVSPGLIVKPWYSLEDYQKFGMIRFLTKLRFSAGADANEESHVNSFATGARMTIVDKGDFRNDNDFLKKHIFDKQDRFTRAWKQYRDEMLLEKNLTPAMYDALSQAEKDEILNSTKEKIGFALDTVIANALKEYKKSNWNATRIDFAYSVLFQSPDSLFSNSKLQKHSFWLVLAIKPGEKNSWSQLLIGINNGIVRTNDKFYNEFTGNLRFYLGANKLKGFLETQYQNLDNQTKRKQTLYSQIGLEVAIYKSIWIHFGTGVLNGLKGSAKSQLQSNLNLSFSFPENFSLF